MEKGELTMDESMKTELGWHFIRPNKNLTWDLIRELKENNLETSKIERNLKRCIKPFLV